MNSVALAMSYKLESGDWLVGLRAMNSNQFGNYLKVVVLPLVMSVK